MIHQIPVTLPYQGRVIDIDTRGVPIGDSIDQVIPVGLDILIALVGRSPDGDATLITTDYDLDRHVVNGFLQSEDSAWITDIEKALAGQTTAQLRVLAGIARPRIPATVLTRWRAMRR